MNKPQKLTLEIVLYSLAFLLALFLRLLNLGAAPLSDREADWALQAMQIAHPEMASAVQGSGAQPAYIILTGFTFFFLGANEFLARFWPALAGALLVWAPFCFRRDLGRSAAVLLAFGLALDPGLTTVSRQAGGPMLALSFSLLALALWRARQPAWAGVAGGLALLSGPTILPGAMGMAAALLTASALRRRQERIYAADPLQERLEHADLEASSSFFSRRDVGIAWIAGLSAFLLIGAGFGRFPQGLAGFFASLIAYFQGWMTPSNISPLTVLLAFLAFELLAITFVAVGVVHQVTGIQRAAESASIQAGLLLWAAVNLLLTLLYPGRQVSDLVWSIVPLWAVAAAALAAYLPRERPHVMVFLQACLVFILAALFWNTMIAPDLIASATIPWNILRLVVLAGILALGVLTSTLVALGWSWEISRDGLIWGLAITLLIYSTGALWGAAQLRPNQPTELWGAPPGTGQARLAQATLRELSNWATGMQNSIEILSLVDSPSLRWFLREYPNARFSSAIDRDNLPDVLITRLEAETPGVSETYRGQDFVWWTLPGWAGGAPPEIIRWLTFRKAPITNQYIILWARNSLFPGAAQE